jgi:alkylation response protein AidB-like acyl-CoA dehydrogenase
LEANWNSLDSTSAWPESQLAACARYGVYAWFVPESWGGLGWSEADLLRAYIKLASACLTTTFVLTQRVAAGARILACENDSLKSDLVPQLLSNERFFTVGISHLTTSRRHLAPVLVATELEGGWVLDGYCPWVTGSTKADTIVVGATMADGRQLLVALDTKSSGVKLLLPEELVGLSASQTGKVECRRTFVPHERLLAGPVENVMKQGLNARTGGLQTSALALGTADRALRILECEAAKRDDLCTPAEALRGEWNELCGLLLRLAGGKELSADLTAEVVRQRANSFVLRAAHAALAATKGAGYVAGHPAGRLCREAMFFLVWSCPQPVTAAHLCELAGLGN